MSSDSPKPQEDDESVDSAEETSVLISSNRRNNVMEAQADHRVTKRYNFFNDLAAVLGLIDIVMLIVWIVKFRGGYAWSQLDTRFNWHPTLMLVGFIFIHAQSILVYRRARFMKKKPLKYLHAILHFTAFVLAVIALVAVFDTHNLAKPPIPNLYSLHSWMGLLAVILFAMQFLFGFVIFLFPGLASNLRAFYYPLHTQFGSFIFLLAVATAVIGLNEKAFFMKDYSLHPPEGVLVNFIGIVTVAFGALVLYLVKEDSYKRVAIADDQIPLSEN